MTPYEHWYQTNQELAIFMDSIFKNEIDQLKADPELHADVSQLFQQGNAVEKTMVMTLLGAIKQLNISI